MSEQLEAWKDLLAVSESRQHRSPGGNGPCYAALQEPGCPCCDADAELSNEVPRMIARIEQLERLAADAIGGPVSDFELLLSSERMACQERNRAMDAVNRQLRIIQELRKELLDLKKFAEGHHRMEESCRWLHALTIDIPARIDVTLKAIS